MITPKSDNIFIHKKLLSTEKAQEKIASLKKQGKKVGLSHGGFDLLHPGHVKHFESAKKLCDTLFVSITTDKHIPGRKGDGRPIYPETLRAYMIANLSCVDHVVLSDVDMAIETLETLKPNYYVRGPDYKQLQEQGELGNLKTEREKREYERFMQEIQQIRAFGGDVIYTEDQKFSTTDVITYIKKNIN